MKRTIFTLMLATALTAPAVARADLSANAGASAAALDEIDVNSLTSSEVTQVQAALAAHGERVSANGTWNAGSASALRAYQQAKGLRASGTLTSETLSSLDVHLNNHAFNNRPAFDANDNARAGMQARADADSGARVHDNAGVNAGASENTGFGSRGGVSAGGSTSANVSTGGGIVNTAGGVSGGLTGNTGLGLGGGRRH